MIVVKVGGSLYDDPRLGPGLRKWLAEQGDPVTLVPGGGAFADAVREADRVHGLGEEASHWLAIRAMSVAADFLETLINQIAFLPPPLVEGRSPLVACGSERREGSTQERKQTPLPVAARPTSPQREEVEDSAPPIRVLDCYDFFRRHDLTPHTWAVTSDSLAAAVANHLAARKLVLLKSVDLPPVPWTEAAANGWVDPHFPTAVNGGGYEIEVVNFRRWMEGCGLRSSK